MTASIEVRGLTKVYDRFMAVDNISFDVQPGEIYGFLGPNGAGKTTTIRMLIGLLYPTEGSITICGADMAKEPEAAKQVTGFVPDRPFLYEKLTAREYLRFVGGLYGVGQAAIGERTKELLDFFELTEWTDAMIESFSHGMKQRVALSGALIHRPRLLIVDEPTVGLDPKGSRLLKKVFLRLASEGVTIFMSTHSLEVAEELCERLSIIQHGRIVATGTLDEIRKRANDPSGNLEHVFLRLTGAEDLSAADRLLREKGD